MAPALSDAFVVQLRDVIAQASRGIADPSSRERSVRAAALCAVAAARSGHFGRAEVALDLVLRSPAPLPCDAALNALEAAAAIGHEAQAGILLQNLAPDLVFAGRIRMVPDRVLRRLRSGACADAEAQVALEINPILDALGHALGSSDSAVRARATSLLVLFCDAIRLLIDLEPDVADILRRLCGDLDPFAGPGRPSAAGFALAASVDGRAAGAATPTPDCVPSDVYDRALGLAHMVTSPPPRVSPS